MIAILATFCLLTLSYVDCAPKSGMCLNYFRAIEHWMLKEAWVKWENTVLLPVHYTGRVRLSKYDDVFSIDTLADDDSVIRNIVCFEITEIYALLDDTIYVITKNPRRVIRMPVADSNQIKSFRKFFEYETIDQTFVMKSRYDLVKMVELDEHLNFKRRASSDYPQAPVIVTEYVELDKVGNDTGKRRFIISGDIGNELYAVFNKGDYNYIQKDTTNRFVIGVRPPLGFEGKLYYGLMMTCRNDTPKNFAEGIRPHVSPLIGVPETVMSLTTAVFDEDTQALTTLADSIRA